jgi:hypothetical protein
MTYKVFVRDWWLEDSKGGLIPGPGESETIHEGIETEEQARALAQGYNRTHKPGRLSRKAEYTEDN